MCANPARHRAQRNDESSVGCGFWEAKELLGSATAGRSGKHARRAPSRYALHIGRVGALAVSLGVGLAVANAGVAYADSDPDTSVTGPKSDDGPLQAPAPQDDADEDSADDADSDAGEDLPEDEETAIDPDGEEEPSDGTDLEPGDSATRPPEGTDEEAPEDGDVDDAPVEQPSAGDSVPARDVEEATAPDDEPPAVDDDVIESPQSDESEPSRDVAIVDVVAPVVEPVAQASAAPEQSAEKVNIVSALVSTVVSPFANPNAPAQAPWFDALLAWVRRQITHTFSNKTPIYGPITIEELFPGQLFIDLNATDPNGDPLTYEIIQPKYGLVVRDLITGKFIYTPTSIVTGTPRQDTFQVVIRDDSEHLTGPLGSFQKFLHGVARLFGLAQKDNVTVTVPVTINPIVQLPPTVVTGGLPVFKLGDSPVRLLSSAVIADADSDRISKATIKIATSGQTGDLLNYVAPDGSPITASWDAVTKTLTLEGLATAQQYEQALLAVTFSATKGGLPRGVAISVTDDSGVQSLVPGAALVTVVGLPPLVVVGGLPIFRLGGAPVKVASSVSITDGDSENLSGATVVIATAYKSGDVLSYVAADGSPITASWDAATGTLTLSGVASIAEYEAAIKAVTFSTTEGGGLPRGISVSVVDDTDTQSLVPGAAVVTVIGLPPVVVVGGLPIFRLGGSPVKVVPSVSITDVDSENLSKATLTIGPVGYRSSDVLSYNTVEGSPITASWDAATRTLTLSGVASIAEYEAAIKAVTFSASEGGVSRAISVSVTDDTEKESLVPGAAVVTVIGLPPVVVVGGLPIFRLGGSPVKVVSSVSITDVDSENLSRATLTIGSLDYRSGDVLSYNSVEGSPITASWDATTRTLTLSGVASIAEYEAAIKAVTFSASEGGVSRAISVSVTDDTDKESLVPGAAVVTVIGLPPVVVVGGLPIFRLGGSPVKVVSSVSITDVDSENLSKATLTIGAAGYRSGDVLSYNTVEGSPITASWDAATRTLTLSGVASIAEYEAAIKAVTFTASEGGVSRSILVSVVDDTEKESLVPGAAVVTVIGLPPVVVVGGLPIFRLGGSPVKVVSSVSITDVDSENLSKATLTIGPAGYKSGDMLAYNATADSPITASWDAATRTLTLSGVASIAEYEAAIKAVTFSASEGGLSRSISVSVTDDTEKESLVPGAAVVTVIGLPPIVTLGGLPIFRLGGAPVKVVSSVSITDVDSDNLSRATLTIGSLGYKSGDVLSYVAAEGGSITASWDAATRTLTLSGVASIAEYEAAIKAVTFTASEGGVSRSILVSVVDDTEKESLVPGAAVVTVIGLPPVVVVGGLPIFRLGGAPVKVVSSVTITDVDSDQLSKATLRIGPAGFRSGDVLSYTTVEGSPITASWDAATGTLTLSGVASIAEYEAAIKAVTFSASEGGVSRSVSVSVVDDTEKESLVPGAAVVTVIGLPPVVVVGGLPIFRLGGAPVKVVSSVSITDGDSDQLSKATLTIGSAGYRAGDVLSYVAAEGGSITASWDAATRTLTLSGVASIVEYEAAIKAVTFSASEGGVSRSISVSVTDDTDKESLVPGAAVVTVIGLPPMVVVSGLPIFRLGGAPVKVVSSVNITDLDSDQLSKATLTIGPAGYKAGDVLAYTAGEGSAITASWDAATRTLTLSGVASIAEYEAAIKAVTFSASEGGVSRSVSVSVTDDTEKESLVPGAAVVTVIGLPPVVVVGGLPIFRLGGAPVKVVSSVSITDVDSENLSKATLTIGPAGYRSGDVLSYNTVEGSAITASWDAATRTLTLSGVASIAEYEAAIKAVTFSASEGGVSRSVSVSVTDDTEKESLVPGAAVVTVIGLPPVVVVGGLPIFRLGGAPVKVVSSVSITDVDSENLSKATLTIGPAGYRSGDVLSYNTVEGSAITASWDAATRTLTLSGVASIAEYEAAIKAVTFSASEGGVSRSVSVSVTDDTEKESLVPGAAVVTVIGLPPVVVVGGLPIFRLGGAPVKVVSSVSITDVDSENLSKATLTIGPAGYRSGDVLSYNTVEGSAITASWDAATRTLTLSGVASIAEYEAAIKAVTFSASEGGVSRSVSVSVTDDTEKESLVPGAAVVTVIGLPPMVVVGGLPIFRLGGAPVKVVSSVNITDGDSDQLSKATLTIGPAGYKAGDVLAYTAGEGSAITASWDAATRTLTLSGVASIAEYEAVIKAVTFSASEGGVSRSVSVSVVDDTDKESLGPGAAVVTVIGLPPVVVVGGLPIFRLGGSAVKVVSSVDITDVDSENLSKATLTIGAAGYRSGDVLSYNTVEGSAITASWDAATRTLTLSGVASIAEYEAAIKAVTFTATEGGVSRGISISVTDDTEKESLVPGAAVVTVIGLPPLVAVLGAPIFRLGGTSVKVVSSVTITDADSESLSKATLTIGSVGYKSGDVLAYNAVEGSPITASWDAATRTLTLSGVASIAEYEAAIKAVTFTATEGGLSRSISVNVTDDTNKESLVPGAATVMVVGLPPSVTALGAAIFRLGGAPVKVVSSVDISDLDSDNLSGATIVVATAYKSGDVLGYVVPSGSPITANWDAATRTLTLSGVASKAQYEQAIKSVTFTTDQGGVSRGIQIHVIDETNVRSVLPGSAIVTVVGLPPSVTTIGAPTFTIGTAPVKLLASVSIADADSDNMSRATVRISSLGQSGDVLGFVAISGNPITATWNATSRTLTLSGIATKAQYEQALEAVTFSATGGAALVRGISVTVTDDTDVDSALPGVATANVRYSLPPSVVTVGAPTHTIGGAPTRLLSSASISDADSDRLSSARVTIESLGQSGDRLGYIQPGNPITAEWDAGSRTLTLSGSATKAQYEEALKAVTFSATQGAGLIRGFSISVSDETGVSSSGLLNGVATAGVRNPVSPTLTTTGWPSHTRNGSATTALASASIFDTDSDYMAGATVRITNASSNDKLMFTPISGNPITAVFDASTHTLTLTGVATKNQYEAAMEAVKFSASQSGFGAVRNLSWTVTDETGRTGSGTSLLSVQF
ncbi:hypothetical protein C6A87_023520 [Mycobacterium sp. ITM-2016-00317]|uniref:hypothetical protein n=1 Tax=Mycobacterium sp. ITM-2016-00317 TaxID=2099694 RepID=UPI00287F665B|nr:hypothetical protein [Mycobacterium sp. ITM-2016-00317]WNG86744.1 hypothetical protein C6A87_023520 [Mycobacterium sp. ITM-2016-00317]